MSYSAHDELLPFEGPRSLDADIVEMAVEGESSWFSNRWERLYTFSDAALDALEHGGMFFDFSLSDPVTVISDDTTVAALWDDGLLASEPIETEEGRRFLLKIPKGVRGTTLELWGNTKNTGARVSLVKSGPLERISDVQQAEEDVLKDNEDKDNLLPDLAKKAAIPTGLIIGMAVVAVGAYLLLPLLVRSVPK